MHKRKLINAMSLTFAVTLMGGSLSSCSALQNSLASTLVLKLSAEKLTLSVGEKVEITIEGGSAESYLFDSSDSNVITVSDDGLVEALNPGTAIVYCYSEDDYNQKGSLQFYVTDQEIVEKDEKNNLTLDTSAAKVKFSQGSRFSVDGLVVKAGDTVIEDFVTNPEVDSVLNSIGTFEVVVSKIGYNSASYEIEVGFAEDDLELYDLVSKLNETDSYHFSSTIEGTIQIDDDTYASKVVYDYRYSTNSYYMKFTADDAVIDNYDFGYVNTTAGVMKYKLIDDVVSPICYLSHVSKNYREVSAYSDLNSFDLDTIPTRKNDDGYAVIKQTLITKLAGMSNIGTSVIYNTMKSLNGYVLGEDAFKFVFDCGITGKITLTFDSIGTEKVDLAEDFVAIEGNEKITADSSITKAFDLINGDNFTRSLGTYGDSKKTAGTVYYTSNYYVVDYTDDYLAYYAENKDEDDPEIYSNGYYFKEGTVYSFNIKADESGNKTIGDVTPVESDLKSLKDSGKVVYPSELKSFSASNIDMYEYKYVDGFGADAYINYGDDCPDEIFTDFLGYTASLAIIPMGACVYYVEGSVDALSYVAIFSQAFDMSGNYYAVGWQFANFGVTSFELVDDYLSNSVVDE